MTSTPQHPPPVDREVLAVLIALGPMAHRQPSGARVPSAR
jgi:hypothetical protein